MHTTASHSIHTQYIQACKIYTEPEGIDKSRRSGWSKFPMEKRTRYGEKKRIMMSSQHAQKKDKKCGASQNETYSETIFVISICKQTLRSGLSLSLSSLFCLLYNLQKFSPSERALLEMFSPTSSSTREREHGWKLFAWVRRWRRV